MINIMQTAIPPADDQQVGEIVRRAIVSRMPKAEQHIAVTVEQGTVHLWGVLCGDEELTELPRIVASVPGVCAVRDHRRAWG